MAGMEHIISMEEMIHSRKVERKEVGETSRGHDQPVIVSSIAIHGETGSEEENFMKLKEARVKGKNRWTTKPKIQKVLWLQDHKDFRKYCEPRVISIGPIHHGKPKYRLAEEYKLILAENFIEESGKTDRELYMVIKNNIEKLRKGFDDEVIHNYNDEALSWMLLVDGCAILKFMDSVVHNNVKSFQNKNSQVAFVHDDIFLLENQLPYQILNDLIKNSKEGKKLKESVQFFIDTQSMTKKTEEPPTKNNKEGEKTEEPVHLLDILRNRLLGCTHDRNPISKEEEWQSDRNVQELKAVGIQLKSSNDSYLLNITFIKKWKLYGGTLSLPRIIVDESTVLKFFNLIAYEMSPDFENDHGVTSYISFLDSLIHEAKDVMHLRQAGIFRNFLGSDEKVAQIFNEIGNDLVPNPEIYREVRGELQKYYRDKKVMIRMSETLYPCLNDPLSFPVLAFSGAVLALTFSLVQMIYAILSYECQRRY